MSTLGEFTEAVSLLNKCAQEGKWLAGKKASAQTTTALHTVLTYSTNNYQDLLGKGLIRTKPPKTPPQGEPSA